MTRLLALLRRTDELWCLAEHARRMRALADINAHVKETRP